MKDFLVIGVVLTVLTLSSTVMAQSVTVGTSGDYATIGAALAGIQGDATGPDQITILDAGPFLESRLLISGDNGAGGGSDIIIEATPGVRPVVAIDYNGDGALAIIRNGNVTVKDLIVIPQTGTPATRAQAAILVDDAATSTGFNVTLQNLLICPNNGSNQPAAAVDGSSISGASDTFRDEGVLCNSTVTTGGQIYNIYMYDVIVSGLTGDQGSDGIRGFPDGSPGSKWILGEGCVMSFNNGIGFQPGGDEGGIVVKVQGTSSKPVKIFGNTGAGISTTSTTLAGGGINEISYCLAVGNGSSGFTAGDSDQSISFYNCTFGANVLEPVNATAAFSGVYSASGCIFAGTGEVNRITNVIDVSTSSSGTMNITDSAIVLAGPLQLDTTNFDLDGLDDNAPVSNVTRTNVITSDPIFLSFDPTNPDFFKVSSPAYASAGPGGGPLGGAMGYSSPVTDWSIY